MKFSRFKLILSALFASVMLVFPAMGQEQSLPSCEMYWIEGSQWLAILHNDIAVSVNHSEVRAYGKWHKFELVISNFTDSAITFDPEKGITASVLASKRKKADTLYLNKPLEVWGHKDYERKVRRSNNWTTAATAVGTGLAAGLSGYSYSYHHGHGGGHYSYSVSTYNAAAAFMANMQAVMFTTSVSDRMKAERNVKMVGYLKPHTLHPGESISGYVLLGHEKGDFLNFMVQIGGNDYPFAWQYNQHEEEYEPLGIEEKADQLPQ